ncbi:MAG: sigma-54 dependent transcriptional regulator [Cyclobacteriaceae bacterium]
MNKKKATILIIDDDPDVLYTAKAILRRQYEQVDTIDNPTRIARYLEKHTPDVILLDMNFKIGATSGKEGLFWLQEILSAQPEAHVVMNTAYGDISIAVECMKNGAIDFLVKPWEKEKLMSTIAAVYELSQSKKQVNRLENTKRTLSDDLQSGYNVMIGQSAAMQPVLAAIRKVAKTDASVLLLGENGTGKELVARAIHKESLRQGNAFIKVDLGAISSTLFESELFGHKKGAFTDAKEDRAGRFEIADKGTLFLDEIGNLDIALQMKLLTVLQNREVYQVGSTKSVPVDIRLISATNSPIEELADSGDFRKDLLYRINTVTLSIPPLRDRPEDIEPLLQHFLEIFKNKYHKTTLSLANKALEQLQQYHWPGNVRELQNAVERAVIMSDGNTLVSDDFLTASKPTAANYRQAETVEEAEKATIIKALSECKGNQSEAAIKLGIGRTTLYRKIKKYGL